MRKASIIGNEHALMPVPGGNGGERVLIVDDDVDFTESTADLLVQRGYQCERTHSVAEFREAAVDFAPHVALIDNRLGNESGIAVLECIRSDYPSIVPIMMTGFAGADAAIEALRHNAYDYLRKPIEPEDFFASLSRAFERQNLVQQGKEAELALIASEEKSSKAFAASPVPITLISLDDQRLIEVNDRFESFSGYSKSEVRGRSLAERDLWLGPDDGRLITERLKQFGALRDHELGIRSRAGKIHTCVVCAELVTIGGSTCAIMAIEDVTRERQMTQELANSERRFRTLYHAMPAMFLTLARNGVVKSVNSYGARILGHDSSDLTGSLIHDYVSSGSRERQAAFISRCFADPSSTEVEKICCICGNGDPIWLRETGQVTRGVGGELELLIVCEDVTTSKALSERLRHQATHDALTGLVNRREFERRLERVLQDTRVSNSRHALCYLDLDQFKIINDTCGDAAGDELLRKVCDLLKGCVRKHDTLARLGGDEFAILMEDCDIARTQRITSQIHGEIQRFRFAWDDKAFNVGVSIGVVAVDRKFADVKEMLNAADTACYEAKEKGTNREHVYRADDVDLARRHGETQWVTKLNDALENGSFVLYQQSVQPLDPDNRRRRLEVLVRLRGDDGILVGPAQFLPAAERYDLSPKIDRWVIENAFHWLGNNLGSLGDIGGVSINISGRSLGDDHFSEFMESLCSRNRVPASMISFEITETAAIKHLSNARRFIEAFKARGYSFALDDFGAGLSSFAYLKNLDVDFIKIDGQFITGIDKDPLKRAIVNSINDIAKVMGKATIAEFVASDEELQTVRQLGIDYAQGFYIAEPSPLADMRPAGKPGTDQCRIPAGNRSTATF